jgi:hypothetical protein
MRLQNESTIPAPPRFRAQEFIIHHPSLTNFRVFRDHSSRSECSTWGIYLVAGLGSQFRGLSLS